jgi:hypothetical protein
MRAEVSMKTAMSAIATVVTMGAGFTTLSFTVRIALQLGSEPGL